jgi:hypothetical protein
MPATYEPIATTTLGSTTNTITFSSIPATYTDLRIVSVGTMTAGFDAVLRLNGNSSTVYSGTFLRSNGSAASSTRITTGSSGIYYLNAGGFSDTIPFLTEIDIFSYTSGSIYKSFLTKLSGDLNGSGWLVNSVGLYSSTTTITSVSLIASSSAVWSVGTTATLYGIKAA